jgi:hypothetical protein
MIVDTATGAIRFGDDDPQSWSVVQEGGPVSDFVAVPRPDPAVAATDFIRLRAWREMKTALFIKYGLSMVITGVCEPIK